ncbi:MAG TPA: DUF1707 domain-containing protein [Streptosporangiaceae bacterium]|nr:DUF1707 domain-containing protein [Streptosporangiaceae bacterium]
MSSLPEPADPRSLRVSDADRDRVAEVLREAVGQGRITFDELDERLSQVYSARTYADLETVTRDLPGPGAVMPPATWSGGPAPDRIGGRPGANYSLAIMSGARRRGPWVVPRTYVAVAIMGSVQLDLRQARFSEPEVTIQAYTIMGGIEIIVPEEIEVDVGGVSIMAAFDHSANGEGIPGAPRLKVTGVALMGGVDVRRKPAQSPLGQGPRALGEQMRQLPWPNTGGSEAAPSQAAPSDARPSDARPSDARLPETGPSGVRPSNAAPPDARPSEAGPSEVAPSQAGPSQAGPSDAGRPGAGPSGSRSSSEAGSSDAGPPAP